MSNSWQDRLQESIILTSPKTKTKFICDWIGSEMGAEKRLGKFSYPLSVGTVVQDLGLPGFDMSFAIYFEGPDHDTQSWAFLLAIAEFGSWEVIHPVRGKLIMQPVGIKAHDKPTESGNITQIDTTWIIPSALSPQASTPALGGLIDSTVTTVAADAATDFTRFQQTLANIAAAYGAVQSGIQSVQSTITNTTAAFLNGYGQIQSAISGLSTDALSIAGMTMNLLTYPGLMIGSMVAQIKGFIASGQSILGLAPSISSVPGTVSDVDYAQACGVELITIGITCAIAKSVISTPPLSRGEAIATIDNILAWWSQVQTALSGTQDIFNATDLVKSYLPMPSSYSSLQELLRLMIQYLLSIIYDLKKEVRFTLKAERAAIAVAIDCYSSKGWDDSYFDLFIASNGLYGDLINLLPAGFEVVYYA